MKMYNNEVTYADKWDTPENKAAAEILDKKYFDRSICSPSCPVAWAPEVLELLETLDKELGIQYNEQTIRAYRVEGNLWEWFITSPLSNMWHAFHYRFLKAHEEDSRYYKKNIAGVSSMKRLKEVLSAGLDRIKYGIKATRVTYINKHLNKYLKPKLTLSQIKEKYGDLVLYFNCPPAFEDYVENLVRKTKIKLAVKGCFYPVESFWDAGTSYNVGNEWRPDVMSVKESIDSKGVKHITITETKYRAIMQELGINLEEVRAKAEAKAAEKK